MDCFQFGDNTNNAVIVLDVYFSGHTCACISVEYVCRGGISLPQQMFSFISSCMFSQLHFNFIHKFTNSRSCNCQGRHWFRSPCWLLRLRILLNMLIDHLTIFLWWHEVLFNLVNLPGFSFTISILFKKLTC